MALRIRDLLFASALFALALPLVGACSSKDTTTPGNTAPAATTGTAAGTGVCLLNSCNANNQCDGCPDGRTTCLVAENRCVACDPKTGSGCKPGEKCSSFGLCAPEGLTCMTDDKGNPTIKCSKNSDCKACDPQHQVCDDKTGKCQACTTTNTQHCLASDICLNGNCSPKCPKACTVDNDCGQCGGPGNEAHACNNHKCAQCSETHACDVAKGEKCVEGKCTPPCGLVGPQAGTCSVKEDCQYCGDPKGMKWDCKFPVNDNKHGFCVPPANGCSDLGKSVVVLPPPYDSYTQTCSNDGDCTSPQKAGIQFNIGKLIRDLVGSDEINVGITKIKIKDANVTYFEPICAKITINEKISCGICVPCKEDKDCAPIPLNPIIADLFKGDALATIAGVILVQTLWGNEKEPKLNFFCQQVVGGYGACLPCANPTAACGKNGGGGGDMGKCDHPVCKMGGALKTSCGECAKSVCANDSYCCDTKWDDLCVKEADQYCNNICSGNACPHNPCTEGDKLDATCGACVAAVCKDDSYCCGTKWDSQCVSEGKDTGKYPACAGACSGGCAHDPCKAGAKLAKACSPCVTAVCGKDTYCCDTEWDSTCLGEAKAEASCKCN